MARWDKAAPASIPEWFFEAVETPVEYGTVTVADCDVSYRRWPDSSGAGGNAAPILLVHGMCAHSGWWDFIAPSLMADHPIAALDLTGMGDSDFRYEYSGALYTEEIYAVLDALDFSTDTLLVGHSFGGFISLRAAIDHPERIGGLVLVDSGLTHPDDASERPVIGGRSTVYADKPTAISRFRLQPPQPCENDYIVEYIARQSVMPLEDGGWGWKFDDDLTTGALKNIDLTPEMLSHLSVPVGLLFGEESKLYTSQSVQYNQRLLPAQTPCEVIAGAQHHVFLDQPLAFIEALKRVIAALPRMAGERK